MKILFALLLVSLLTQTCYSSSDYDYLEEDYDFSHKEEEQIETEESDIEDEPAIEDYESPSHFYPWVEDLLT